MALDMGFFLKTDTVLSFHHKRDERVNVTEGRATRRVVDRASEKVF
jgi:hypothetical protein